MTKMDITDVFKDTPVDQYEEFVGIIIALGKLQRIIHKDNEKWWIDLHTGKRKERNVGELLMLVVSEIAEGMEGDRKGLMDDKLPHRNMLEVELADAIIRILDIGEGKGLDIPGAIVEKMMFNRTREDHSREARLASGGKKY